MIGRPARRASLGVVASGAVMAYLACAGDPAPTPQEPLEWSATATVDKTTAQVGEDLTLTVSITHPADAGFVAPYAASLEPFELIDRQEQVVSPYETNVVYRIAAYRLPERLTIPALEVQYRGGETVEVLTTNPIEIDVVTSLTPDVTDIHDIKGQVALDVPLPWSPLWWLLLALVLAGIAYWIYRRFSREPEDAPRVISPPVPPHEEALAALARLRQQKHLEQERTRLFYDGLAEIMKRYVGRVYEVAFLERTTHEILSDLRPRRIPELQTLRELLQLADLVKFARQVPPIEQGHRLLEASREFVLRTRPRPSTGAAESLSSERSA